MIISKKLDLCYRLSFGKMTKWLEGLTKGQAFALKCENCKKVSKSWNSFIESPDQKFKWIRIIKMHEKNIKIKKLAILILASVRKYHTPTTPVHR